MSSEDLVAYLRARLDEEERNFVTVGHGGYAPALWRTRPSRSGSWVEVYAVMRTVIEPPGSEVDEGDLIALVATGRNEHHHIAYWDPARVLADIEAKRRLLDLHVNQGSENLPACKVCDVGFNACGCVGWDEWPCETLKILVQPYSSRSDFNEDWRTP